MPIIAIYDWSLYTTSLTTSELESSTHGNDPAQTGSNPYNPSAPTWTGVDFTFNGGAASVLQIDDDDGFFEDGYVETGGAQTLAQDITINGVDFFVGDVVENEFSLIDSAGNEVWIVRINGINVGFAYPQGVPPTASQVFNANDTRDGAPEDSLDQSTPSDEAYTDILCFAEGTLILTPDGERPVESLRPGDPAIALDRQARPVRWTRKTTQRLDHAKTSDTPVLITAGALGTNSPTYDLIVSPQHRILVGGEQLGQVFAREVLAPAKSLTLLPGIRHMKGKSQITWVHFACDPHQVVRANGCWSESLLLGPMTVNGLNAAERQALAEIFERAPARGAALNGPPARDCISVGAGRRQVAKFLKEDRQLAKVCEAGTWTFDTALEQYVA